MFFACCILAHAHASGYQALFPLSQENLGTRLTVDLEIFTMLVFSVLNFCV